MEWVGLKQEISEKGWTGSKHKRLSHDTDHLPVIQSAPGSVADDEEGYDDLFEEDVDDLPWHHQQLYRLYGKDADYFLYPKTEDELNQDKVVKDRRFSHLFNSQGAQELWQALRGQSIAKLATENTSMRPHLKDAYSAFVRESIQHRSNKSKDNFFLRSGVEDVSRLMDDAKIKSAQDRQRKVNIMYRTSRINEDKFAVLTYNNPLDNLARPDVPESVGVYMPSWTEHHSDGDTIRNSGDNEWRKSGIRSPEIESRGNRNQKRDNQRSPGGHGGAEDEAGGDVGPQLLQHSEDWSFIRDLVSARSAKRQHTQQPRYIFLTEEAAWEPGQFSKRRQEAQDATNNPQVFNGKLGASEEHVMQTNKDGGKELSKTNSTSSIGERRSSNSRRIVQWQPLTLNALVGNKRQIEAPGEGRFNHGKTAVWAVGH